MYERDGTNGTAKAPQKSFAHNISELANDVMTLSELQLELAKIDAQQGLKRMLVGAGLFVVAAMTTVGTIVLLLQGIAHMLVVFADMQLYGALLTSAAIGLVVTCLCAFIGLRLLTKGNLFTRSKEELRRNIRWFKRAIKGARANPMAEARAVTLDK
jgi:uncharacterized membrane protein YqjE